MHYNLYRSFPYPLRLSINSMALCILFKIWEKPKFGTLDSGRHGVLFLTFPLLIPAIFFMTFHPNLFQPYARHITPSSDLLFS